MREKRNDICPKCHHKIRKDLPKGKYLDYFTHDCGQDLALTREGKHVRLYIDDATHMGFMTSGIGGY